MKKRTIILAIFILVFVIMFFPVSSTHNISGNGAVLNVQKEKIGECKLDIEITEISSLIICYKKCFAFTIDGKSTKEFSTNSHAKAKGICLISQMYYDKDIDAMHLCSLIYNEDYSYAVLDLGANYYFINNGSDIAYDELPIS